MTQSKVKQTWTSSHLKDAFLFSPFHLFKSLSFSAFLFLLSLQRFLLLLINERLFQLTKYQPAHTQNGHAFIAEVKQLHCDWLCRSRTSEITNDVSVCCNAEYLNFDTQNLRPSNIKVIFQRPSCDVPCSSGFRFHCQYCPCGLYQCECLQCFDTVDWASEKAPGV